MKDSKKKLSFSSPVGYSFMLTIMIVLTLVIFAVLSLSASLRDYEYSRRAAEKTTAYYEANSKAYELLGQMDGIFEESGSLEEGICAVLELPEVKVLTAEEMAQEQGLQDFSRAVSFEVEINSNQKLSVLLGVTEDEAGKVCYKILRWKEVSADIWESDATLPVIGGNE